MLVVVDVNTQEHEESIMLKEKIEKILDGKCTWMLTGSRGLRYLKKSSGN
jgi:hypothetical protein